jgi:hypothetical protein
MGSVTCLKIGFGSSSGMDFRARGGLLVVLSFSCSVPAFFRSGGIFLSAALMMISTLILAIRAMTDLHPHASKGPDNPPSPHQTVPTKPPSGVCLSPSNGRYCVLNAALMALLGSLKRIFWAHRPSYKRVSSTGSNRRLSNPPPPDVDDEYEGDDDIVHGGFVYCAFLMLGFILQWDIADL